MSRTGQKCAAAGASLGHRREQDVPGTAAFGHRYSKAVRYNLLLIVVSIQCILSRAAEIND